MLKNRYLTDAQIFEAAKTRLQVDLLSGDRAVANKASDHTLKVIVEYLKENRGNGFTSQDGTFWAVFPNDAIKALKELVK